MSDPVQDRVEALAKALVEDARTRRLREAQAALQASPKDAALQKRYHETAHRIAELEAEGRPVEPPLKREAATLADEVRRSTVLQALLRAHAEFSAMMEAVSGALSQAVDEALGGGEGDGDGDGGTAHGD